MMARYKMYIDIWDGLDPDQYGITASSMPGAKPESTKRLVFEVSIPDEWIYKQDKTSTKIIEPKESED